MGKIDIEFRSHYRHPDWQGSVTMTTDSKGALVQHTGYYPYGEPWREPSGQPYLFAGKERLRDLALNDYDFTARRLSSALCLWTSPDPLAQRFADTGPYIYCSANPVKFIDPSGCVIVNKASGDDREKIDKMLNYFRSSYLYEGIMSKIDGSKETYYICVKSFQPAPGGLESMACLNLTRNTVFIDPKSLLIDPISAAYFEDPLIPTNIYFGLAEELYHLYQNEVTDETRNNIEFEAKCAAHMASYDKISGMVIPDGVSEFTCNTLKGYADSIYLDIDSVKPPNLYIKCGKVFSDSFKSIDSCSTHYTVPVDTMPHRFWQFLVNARSKTNNNTKNE